MNLSLRQGMEKNYSDSINILQAQWYQADLNQRFTINDQEVWGLIFPGVATYRRKIWNFNIMNPISEKLCSNSYSQRDAKNSRSAYKMPIS
jgi:hypothetical protein